MSLTHINAVGDGGWPLKQTEVALSSVVSKCKKTKSGTSSAATLDQMRALTDIGSLRTPTAGFGDVPTHTCALKTAHTHSTCFSPLICYTQTRAVSRNHKYTCSLCIKPQGISHMSERPSHLRKSIRLTGKL